MDGWLDMALLHCWQEAEGAGIRRQGSNYGNLCNNYTERMQTLCSY
jgi:hypothetical protein